jgi:hypothetical protein
MDTALAAETAPLSQVERVVDTFVAPSKTFLDVLRSTSWWMPFVIGIVVSYTLTFAVSSKVGWSQLVDNEIHAKPSTEARLADATPEQVAMQHKVMQYSFQAAFFGAPVFSIVALLFYSVILWPTINFAFGGTATYPRVFAVANYAFLPAAIKAVISALVLLFGGVAENFTVENMLGTSPGYFIETPGALKTFLTSFDIFTLWTLVLLSLGLSIVAKTKRSSGFIVVFGWWLLIVLVQTGIAAVTGG